MLLPTFLRRPVLFAFAKALTAPIADLHYRWTLLYRWENLQKMSYNGQRCYLRKALNDRHDSGLRRITIGSTPNLEQDYIYTTSENLSVFLGTMWLENEFSYAGTNVDFLVFVPQEVFDNKREALVATLEFYKLAGKFYQIIAI